MTWPGNKLPEPTLDPRKQAQWSHMNINNRNYQRIAKHLAVKSKTSKVGHNIGISIP